MEIKATPVRSPGLRFIVDPPGVIAPGILMIIENEAAPASSSAGNAGTFSQCSSN